MKLMPLSEVKAKLGRLVTEIEARDEEIITPATAEPPLSC